jgi:hypothetical protein
MWRAASHFASQRFLGEEFWRAFFETLFLCRSPQASLLSNAWHDSLAKYASLTTFGHMMVHSMTFARKHVSIAVRQIMLPCARICFLAAPFYASSHKVVGCNDRFAYRCAISETVINPPFQVSAIATINISPRRSSGVDIPVETNDFCLLCKFNSIDSWIIKPTNVLGIIGIVLYNPFGENNQDRLVGRSCFARIY